MTGATGRPHRPVLAQVGTSGWEYADWRGTFYPQAQPRAHWLEWYASCFATVEVNNTFYRLPERHTFEEWAARTPGDFTFAIKASRYLTHVRRLREPAEPVRRLAERLEGLGGRLGPVLVQLPPTMRADPEALDAALAAFPASLRVAVEPRHRSWFVDDVRRVLERRASALCLFQATTLRPPWWRTADWGYVRFHGDPARPTTNLRADLLARWAGRVAESWPDGDVWCYFNNDAGGCAPTDAGRFARALRRRGMPTARAAQGSARAP